MPDRGLGAEISVLHRVAGIRFLNTRLHCAFSWGFSPFCASGPLGGTQEPQDEGPTFRQRDGDGPGEALPLVASNLLPFPLVVSLTHQSKPAVNWAWSF